MSVKVTAILLAAMAWLAASASAGAQTYYSYQCTDGASFELAFFPETKAAFLHVDGRSMRLPKRFSLISQRFAKDGVTLSVRSGGNARIKHSGKTSDCRVN